MPALCGLPLLGACGSEDGFVVLGDAGQQGRCGTVVEGTFREGRLASADDHAELRATGLDFPISATIGVDCSRPLGQIGNAYDLAISQSFPNVLFSISYAHLDLTGINPADLRLGTYNVESRLWIPEGNARPNFVSKTISISGPRSERYAIYREAPSGGGDVLPPTTPIIEFVGISGNAIEIRWTPSEDPGGGFISVYLISRNPPGSEVASVDGTRLSFRDDGQLIPFDDAVMQNYCYRVTAVDDDGSRSFPSPEVCSPPFLPE